MKNLNITDLEIILAKIVYIINKFNINYFSREDINNLCIQLELDKEAYVEKDPSAHNDSFYLLLSFSSFNSVVCYRIANLIYYKFNNKKDAKLISEYAKVNYGIEIHPAAKIGHSFVIDHGHGTVIGETCIIGDNCYFLQKIILGATKITNNKQENRHPIVGNNVEIGGFSRIYGRVRIGDNVKISPHSIIYDDIPAHHSVIVKSNTQYVRGNK